MKATEGKHFHAVLFICDDDGHKYDKLLMSFHWENFNFNVIILL